MISQPGLGWLKDYYFHFFFILRSLSDWSPPVAGESYTGFRFEFGVRESYSASSRLVLWLSSRLGRTQLRSPSELRRRPGYVLVEAN
jgi:hypothetical protein